MQLIARMVTSAVVSLLTFSGAALAQSDEPELEDLLRQADEIDMQFHEVARSIPIFDQQQAAAYVDETAQRSEISGIEVKGAGSKRLVDTSGGATPIELHTIAVSGTAEYFEISAFLRELRIRPILTSLESLRISAGSSPRSSFTARVAVASMNEVPEEESFPAEDVEDALLVKLQRDRAKLDAVLRYVEEVQTDRRLEALTRFVNSISEDHVALTEVLLDESGRIDIAGVAMGRRALAGLEKDLDDAGFIGRTTDLTGERGCTTFRFSATVRRGHGYEVVSSGRDPFDGGAAQRCSVGAEPSIRSIQAGTGDGVPVVALRRIDFVDLFFVLHDLFAMNFVIDETVIGSLDLEVFDDVGVKDILTALRGAIHIGEGPLHRVSLSVPVRSSGNSGAGKPVNLSFRRVPLRHLLCLAQSIDGREIRIPTGSAARVSIFAERPLDEVVDGLLAPAGFPPPSTLAGSSEEPACAPTESPLETSVRIQPHAMGLADFSAGDLELAGVAILGDVRHAYVYTPGRVLRRIEAGQEIFGGRVSEVTSSGVRVALSSGDVELTFPE